MNTLIELILLSIGIAAGVVLGSSIFHIYNNVKPQYKKVALAVFLLLLIAEVVLFMSLIF